MDHVTITMPLKWTVCHSGLGLAVINLHVKFEVSTFTHYEDMKSDKKCQKLDRLVWAVRSSAT